MCTTWHLTKIYSLTVYVRASDDAIGIKNFIQLTVFKLFDKGRFDLIWDLNVKLHLMIIFKSSWRIGQEGQQNNSF
jgi:hypothetical protein